MLRFVLSVSSKSSPEQGGQGFHFVPLNAWLALKSYFLQTYLIIEIDHKAVFVFFFLECFGWNIFLQSETQENKSHLDLGCPDILSKLLCQNMIFFFFFPASWQILRSRILIPRFSLWVSPVPAILRMLSLKMHPSNFWAGGSTADTTLVPRTGFSFLFPPSHVLLWISWLFC